MLEVDVDLKLNGAGDTVKDMGKSKILNAFWPQMKIFLYDMDNDNDRECLLYGFVGEKKRSVGYSRWLYCHSEVLGEE